MSKKHNKIDDNMVKMYIKYVSAHMILFMLHLRLNQFNNKDSCYSKKKTFDYCCM